MLGMTVRLQFGIVNLEGQPVVDVGLQDKDLVEIPMVDWCDMSVSACLMSIARICSPSASLQFQQK